MFRPSLSISTVLLAALYGALLPPTSAQAEREINDLMGRLMAAPTIETVDGFRAEILIAPGEFYDPLWLHAHGDAIWLNDDGGEEGEKGSKIVSLDRHGRISDLITLGRMLPVTGFDVAPAGFAEFAGHIYAVAQAKVAAPGAVANHVIQRVDPDSDDPASIVCTLQETGSTNSGISGFGVDARFGPNGTAFANRFFAITAFNNTIYQVSANNVCTPFVTFDGAVNGAPMGLAFAADGQSMLVTLKAGGVLEPTTSSGGRVVRVAADGTVDERAVVEGLSQPMGLMHAPASFGPYAGQLFITDTADIEAPVPMTQALQNDGKVFRMDAAGKLHLVASGFKNPVGMLVVDGALWVTDINGDFIAGKRELPDGFIVKLSRSEK
ncbi:MAG: hypothetical protein ACU85U_20285 [Gammaproteobacteria bacterium]|jgi:hypothetical protein